MITKATIRDGKSIHELINSFAQKGVMLPRSLNYVYENIRDFWVYREKNRILGCCALHVVGWDDLAEIKSLSVHKRRQGRGNGASLVNKCLEEAADLGIRRVFALTYAEEFFKKLGFLRTETKNLPHKIWTDCVDCAFFPNCKEIAVIREL